MNLHTLWGAHRCPIISTNTSEKGALDTRTLLDSIIYQELARHEARCHHHTGSKTRKQALEPILPSKDAEAIKY